MLHLFCHLFRRKFDKLRTSLFLFDTIGLGVFTLIGLEKGINIGLHPVICIALGYHDSLFWWRYPRYFMQ
jgi:uncharacterized membrane protein YeiH